MSLKKYFLLLLGLVIITCSDKEAVKENNKATEIINLQNLDRNHSANIEDFVTNTEYLILKTGDKFFGEITKLIFKNNKIYLLDGYRGKIIMVFDRQGNLLSSFTHQGDGPGEFRSPSDMWVNTNGNLELLDESLRKLIVYNEDGKFIEERRLPFAAEKFVKTDQNYTFFTNNIAFAFGEDSNETGLVISTDHNLQNPQIIIPADLDRKDFYYVTTQNFTQLNNQWFFFQPFSHELTGLSDDNNIILEFGDLNFPKDFFGINQKRGMDMMTDLYNLGKAWDNGAFYDLGDYIYFKFQINLTVYMSFYDKQTHEVTTAKRNNWEINSNCIVSRFDPITSTGNQLVFHLLPNHLKMLDELSCLSSQEKESIDENNVLMLWTVD
tara:strand:+ start:308 stop:1450 length:1143 start_codon:yes stop_codon:yes gene_type:complete